MRVLILHSLDVATRRIIHNLALVGFMGSGKSTVGRLVAQDLDFQFVDTDALIEEKAGIPISEIFATEGEEAFRQLERETILELAKEEKRVIATGGGAIMNPENFASLKSHALVVCLWATAESIHERTKHQTHRPLLQGADPLGAIRTMLAEREPVYKQADVIVNTELRPQREVIAQVRHQFEESYEETAGRAET
ncbi:MAG: shikimate kinase [Verrucomicrobiota bacterium]|nr:shikimate kinase [Verrucomicrobiota bacterium]